MAHLRPQGETLLLSLAAQEVEVLLSLAQGLALRLTQGLGENTGDPVIERLAPTVSRGDAELDAELRGMLRPELLTDRQFRLEAFAEDLRSWRHGVSGAVDRQLDRASAMSAIEVLNDIRLALATTIGHDAEPRESLAEGDPRQDAVQLLDALAWLQGGLIDFVDD